MPQLPFKVGSDPEFSLIVNGLKIDASQTFQKFIKEYSGKIDVGNHGNLGQDHNGIAEIRPTPEHDPRTHTAHIGALLARCHQAIPIAELNTTSLWAPIGGHVHLETPRDWTNFPVKKQQAIHKAMMSFSLPLFIGENAINAKIRQQTTYGKITDVRVEQKGTSRTWEFRPLTAEWLTTPDTANATLGYLAVIWNEFAFHPERINKYKKIIVKNLAQAEAIQSLAVDQFAGILDGYIREISKAVKTFEFYQEYKKECDMALNPKAMLDAKEKVKWNIVRGWNLSENKNVIPSKRNLNSDKLTSTRLSKINLDLMKGYQQIFWSQDRNIERIARKVGDRALAWNWNFVNRYFFFGLPKGIPSPIVFNANHAILTGAEMMKTQGDAGIVNKILAEATESFETSRAWRMKSVDIKNGKSKEDTEHTIAVGVPYNMREEGTGKELIAILHDIEQSRTAPGEPFNSKDLNLPNEHEQYKKGFLLEAINDNSKVPETQSLDNIRTSPPNTDSLETLNDVTGGNMNDPSSRNMTESLDAENTALDQEEELPVATTA